MSKTNRAAQIADFAALVRSHGTNKKWHIDLAGGVAEIYTCPQPHFVECWLTLKNVPMAVAQDIDQGGWKTIEGAVAAVLSAPA